jgi:hypothetical protein
MAKALPFSYFGLSVSGDFGPFTIYQNKNRKTVSYPRSPPKVPKTPAQAIERDRFRCAIATWRSLPQSTRDAWETMTKKASLCATGLNAWIHFSYCQNVAELSTLRTLTRIYLPMPPQV